MGISSSEVSVCCYKGRRLGVMVSWGGGGVDGGDFSRWLIYFLCSCICVSIECVCVCVCIPIFYVLVIFSLFYYLNNKLCRLSTCELSSQATSLFSLIWYLCFVPFASTDGRLPLKHIARWCTVQGKYSVPVVLLFQSADGRLVSAKLKCCSHCLLCTSLFHCCCVSQVF